MALQEANNNFSTNESPSQYKNKMDRSFEETVRVEELEEYVRTSLETGELKSQYKLVPVGPLHPCNVGARKENKDKNRYTDLLPYDYNRVVLRRTRDDLNSDYINASYIDCFRRKKAFIVTQGPLENTVSDFWRMVWQEGIERILMVCNVLENGVQKCEKYWPEKKSKCGKILISFKKEQVYLDHTVRTFILQKNGASRYVKQYHFTGWLDHGTPTCHLSLASVLQEVDRFLDKAPVLLHCSAGVGRTGTVLLLASALEMLRVEEKIAIPDLLENIRNQRLNSVETLEQYIYVHQALVETLLYKTNKLVNEIVLYLNVIRKKDGLTSQLETQFNKLQKICPPLKEESCYAALSPDNKDKNRRSNILPPESGRYMFPQNSHYINAVYVSGFGSPDKFIVTQYPVSNTVVDMWKMVLQSKATNMVLLNHLSHHDKRTPVFWANDGCKYFDQILVDHIVTKEHPGFVTRKFKVKDMSEEKSKTKIIRQYHYHDWSKEEYAPPSLDTFRLLLEKVLKRQNKRAPLIVMCHDGSVASGYFCAATFLYDQAKKEGRMDVFQAVRAIRLFRPSFIPNAEQYRWLYELACQMSPIFLKHRK